MFDSIPLELAVCGRLRTLLMNGNPQRTIKHDVLARGTPAVLQYLKERIAPDSPLLIDNTPVVSSSMAVYSMPAINRPAVPPAVPSSSSSYGTAAPSSAPSTSYPAQRQPPGGTSSIVSYPAQRQPPSGTPSSASSSYGRMPASAAASSSLSAEREIKQWTATIGTPPSTHTHGVAAFC